MGIAKVRGKLCTLLNHPKARLKNKQAVIQLALDDLTAMEQELTMYQPPTQAPEFADEYRMQIGHGCNECHNKCLVIESLKENLADSNFSRGNIKLSVAKIELVYAVLCRLTNEIPEVVLDALRLPETMGTTRRDRLSEPVIKELQKMREIIESAVAEITASL